MGTTDCPLQVLKFFVNRAGLVDTKRSVVMPDEMMLHNQVQNHKSSTRVTVALGIAD